MRVEYRTRIAELNEVIREREQRITDLEIRVAEVERENNNLHNVVGKLRRELSRHVDT